MDHKRITHPSDGDWIFASPVNR